MKKIFLVAESLPLRENGTKPKCVHCGDLGDELVALDPRHGVFPNFVMTPLLAALFSMKNDAEYCMSLMEQLKGLLADKSERRFNVFKQKRKEKNEPFTIDDVLYLKLTSFNVRSHLWMLIGYQTTFGLLAWMLKGGKKRQRNKIEEFAFEFLSTALSNAPETLILA